MTVGLDNSIFEGQTKNSVGIDQEFGNKTEKGDEDALPVSHGYGLLTTSNGHILVGNTTFAHLNTYLVSPIHHETH